MSDLRSFTLWARGLLTQEAGDLLQQVYRLDAQTGARLPIPKGHLLETSAEAKATREKIEKLLEDEVDAGLKREEAVAKLIKETAFTHLNRFVAFKLMEARGLVRSPLARRHEANGFKMWLGNHHADETLYNKGDSPNERDGFGEAPRDQAYRHFLLWQCAELAKEIKVLFDPDNVPSMLFPRPGVLKELVDALNADDRKQDWAAGNEETVGWVYQYFNAEEKDAAFDKVFKKKKKFEKADLPAATQVFTPRWVVRFLVENSLGRHWLAMHPDSPLGEKLAYLVPLPSAPPSVPVKPVKEIRMLDPATGTMHFGLVAFELLTQMYRDELAHAGTAGWPAQASSRNEAEIPAAILANNLFGIDIDLRAVQLAALALYLKAKATNKQSVLTESNLACADVAIFRGQHLNKITGEMALPSGVTRELFAKFRDSLEEASMMGSLVRLDKHFQNIQSDRLRQSIDAYVEKKRSEGVDESYFANETGKGLRLLKVLERRYDIIFTNPPYMFGRNMNPAMSEFLKRKRNYERSKGDLYSAFIERCAELLGPDGRLAMLTQQSFMFISTMDKLRLLLEENTAIETMAHLGPKAFDEVKGEKVNVTAFVLRREQLEEERREARGVYFRLVKDPDAESKRAAFEQALTSRRAGQPNSRVYEYRQGDFPAIPGSPWVYWIAPSLLRLFSRLPKLAELSPPRAGLQTGNNSRFIRFWWEVGAHMVRRSYSPFDAADKTRTRWFPLVKGESFLRWYGNQNSVLNWYKDGVEVRACAPSAVIRNPECYFHKGVAFPLLSSKGLSARVVGEGYIYDISSPFVLTETPEIVCAVLNSSLASYLLGLLNPTLNFPPGDVGRLPFARFKSDDLTALVRQAVTLAMQVSAERETTFDFVSPAEWSGGVEHSAESYARLADTERMIDEEVYRLYEISAQDRDRIQIELAATPETSEIGDDEQSIVDDEATEPEEIGSVTIEDLAQRWISYAVGIALGRFVPGETNGQGRGHFAPEVNKTLVELIDTDGLMVIQSDNPGDLAQRVIDILAVIHSDAEAGRIVRTAVGGNGDLRDSLASYLLGPFFKAHIKQYRKRPVYWLLQSPKQNFSVYLFHERAADQALALLQGKPYLGGRIFQVREQLDQSKQKELTTEGKEKAHWKRKAQEAAEELSDLEAFQQAIDATNAEPILDAHGQPAIARWVPEFDDGVLLNAAPLHRLTPAWKKADAKLDLSKVWKALKDGEYPWAKTAMRYWPRETLAACKDNKSYRIAHGLE